MPYIPGVCFFFFLLFVFRSLPSLALPIQCCRLYCDLQHLYKRLSSVRVAWAGIGKELNGCRMGGDWKVVHFCFRYVLFCKKEKRNYVVVRISHRFLVRFRCRFQGRTGRKSGYSECSTVEIFAQLLHQLAKLFHAIVYPPRIKSIFF